MSKIVKKYWRWDESLTNNEFPLGDSIIPKIKQKLVVQNKNSKNEYFGKDGFPWVIETKNNKIMSVYYRECFFSFGKNNLWELEVEEFSKKLDNLLEPVETNFKGKILYVAFRGSFVAIAGIIDNTNKK